MKNNDKDVFSVLIASEDDVGIRLDRHLRNKMNLNQALICKYIRNGSILVNGKKTKVDHRMQSGETIEIIPWIEVRERQSDIKTNNKVNKPIINKIENSIIYENDDILVLNKPFGIATQSGGSLRFSIDDIMRKMFKNEIRIVHRLDKDTSGILVLAKKRIIASDLARAFKDGEIQKVYLANVSPIPKQNQGTVRCKIAKDQSSKISRSQIIDDEDEGGKEAVSDYKILKTNPVSNIALVEFRPRSGRTHQLRIHAAHIGCPIIGDFRYNGRLDLGRRLQLFAHKIKLPQKIHKDWIICNDLPDFFSLRND